MEALSTIDLQSVGFVALVTFGAVSAVNFWRPQSSRTNFVLSVIFALGLGFVPADMGNMIANRIKDAIMVATGLNGAYQALSKIATRVGQ